MSWKEGVDQIERKKDDRDSGLGQTFGYKPWSDFGPLGRNRALPSCHSSLYQQRDEEPSSLEEEEPSNKRKSERKEEEYRRNK